MDRTYFSLAVPLALAALLVTGCSRDEGANSSAPVSSDRPVVAHPPPASGAAVSGVVSSDTYRMSFSLGGSVSPMASDSYQSNRGGQR